MHRTTLEARRHVRGEDHGRARADPPLLYSVRCIRRDAWSEPARLSESSIRCLVRARSTQ